MNHQDNAQAAVTIMLATPEDTPALVKLHTAAFRSDLFSNLMLLNRPEGTHQALMLKSIDFWFTDAHTNIIKAVDANGQIVGWACWVPKGAESYQASSSKAEKGYPSPAVKQEATPPDGKKTETGQLETSEASVQGNNTSSEESTPPAHSITQDPARVLGGLMREEMVKQEDKYLGGKSYMVLQALVTDPSYQGQGIGTQLVHWGTNKADVEELPCWAHASPAGNSLYAKAGFKELDKSDYNLAEWAPGGKSGNRGWGTYTFRYMLRPVNGSVI